MIRVTGTDSFCFVFQDKGQLVFEEQWPLMRPTILKLLRQEPVSRAEWHELFWSVHMVCLWDEKSHTKMYRALQDDILEFIKQAQTVRTPRFARVLLPRVGAGPV